MTTNRVCRAQVAELVDALVSGTSGRKAVGVRVPSWASSSGTAAHAGTPPTFRFASGYLAEWNDARAGRSIDDMKNDTAPCTCGHLKSQHNPAGRCLVQASSQ